MNRNDAIDLARAHALAHGQDHAYLPTTDAEAAEWLPHAWVVDAVVSVAHAQDIALRIKTEEHDCCAEDLLKLRQELQNIAEAKRFDREHFDDDTSFADWAQSRARRALGA